MISTSHFLFLTAFTPIFSFVHGLPLDPQFVAQAGPRRDSTETFTLNADTLEAGLVLSSETLLSAPSPAVVATSMQELAESAAPLVMAYYPDWAASEFPPESIDFTRFDWIDFAFALPDDNCGLTWDDPQEAPSLLTRLVNAAHAHGKKVKLSVGGWTGSRNFSPAVASAQSRQLFVKNMLDLYSAYDLDGIDIDWEYPGQEGSPGNRVAADDTANFLLFLQLLRATLPRTAKITAAVQPEPFMGSNGSPMTDVSDFAKVLDWTLIMNYDVWGSSAEPGPNAPFFNNCHNATQPNANAVSAFKAWTSAGMPASQLVLGLPSYAYISSSKALSLHDRAPQAADPNGNATRPATPMVQVHNDDGGSDGGQVQFRSLLAQGALMRDSFAKFVGAGGFERYWDQCSSTPFLRSESAGQVVTYDDTESLGVKASFAKKMSMRGVNLFDVHGDTEDWALTDAIRRSLGL